MGELLALLNAVFMGTANVCARKGMNEGKIDKFSGLFLTLVVNNILNVVFLLTFGFGQGKVTFNLPGLAYNILAGISNSFTGRWTLFCSIAYIGASRAGILKIVTPLFAILGGVLLLNEKPSSQAWLGILIILSGVAFISIETSKTKGQLAVTAASASETNTKKSNKSSLPVKGIILGLLASLFFAGGNICRKLGVLYIPNPFLSVTLGSFAALISAGLILLACGKGKELLIALKNINKSYLLAGIFTSLALYCLFGSLQLIPISITSSIGASEALFTILASRVLLGNKEVLNWRVVTGALIVVSGVILLILM
ncbi:MAG TPA: DMT family transporter [Bacillota bacterium]